MYIFPNASSHPKRIPILMVCCFFMALGGGEDDTTKKEEYRKRQNPEQLGLELWLELQLWMRNLGTPGGIALVYRTGWPPTHSAPQSLVCWPVFLCAVSLYARYYITQLAVVLLPGCGHGPAPRTTDCCTLGCRGKERVDTIWNSWSGPCPFSVYVGPASLTFRPMPQNGRVSISRIQATGHGDSTPVAFLSSTSRTSGSGWNFGGERVDIVAVVNLTASGHSPLLFNSNNNFWFVSLHF